MLAGSTGCNEIACNLRGAAASPVGARASHAARVRAVTAFAISFAIARCHNRATVRCLDANEVVRFLDGEEPGAAYEDHIDRCADCRALVTELGRAIDVAEPAHGSHDEPWEVSSGAEVVDRGSQVDRYVVLDAIGAGAMGVVYRAYDPDLDRDVALKLVRVLGDHAHRDRSRARLLREAQTMARLAHPNVVAVYDASIYGAHVFVAMELVEGVDLEAHLKARPRSWRAIAALFAEAGRGLAAAHAAGVVHRDFKPSNVLVGDDRRVRVTDFGLAVSSGAAEAADGLATGSSRITEAGTVIGTPAYMSPEVRAGAPADERSDQYSFAVALCEAVTGDREASAKLPAPLRALVRRALAPAPAARYPSMAAVVAALERALVPRTRRGLPVAAAGLAGIAALTGYLVATRPTDTPSCAPPTARFAGIWDAGRRVAIRDAFTATQHPRAAEAYRTVEPAFERFARTWSRSHVAACEATHVRHAQSDELLDRRMACLDAELARFAALTEMFAHADRDVVARVPGVTDLAERIARCDDVAALRDAALPAPAMRARAAAATEALARVEVTSLRGKYADAIAGAQRVIAEAIATADVRLEADAIRSLGESQWRAGDYEGAIQNLHRAVDAAKRARDPGLEAGALLTLVAVLGYEEARYAEALQVARLAESAIRAIGDQRQLASLLGNRAAIHYAKADFAAARADYEQALAIFERILGPEDRRTGQTVMNLAMVTAATGQEAAALPLYARALAILEAALGPRHPEIALALANRAIPLANLGRHADAMRDLERALAIRIEQLGPTHRDVIGVHTLMGEIEIDRGNHEAALVHLRAALAAYDRTLRADHPLRAVALAAVGRSLVATKRWREATETLERALAIWEPVAPDGAMQAAARFDLARALWETAGDRTRARGLAREAHAWFATDAAQQAAIATWLEGHR